MPRSKQKSPNKVDKIEIENEVIIQSPKDISKIKSMNELVNTLDSLKVIPILNQEYNPEYQMIIFADRILFRIEDGKRKLVVESFAPKGVLFEVKSPSHPPGTKYITSDFNLRDLLFGWRDLYPTKESQPNVVVEGFEISENKRKILALGIDSPQLNGNEISFNYNLNQFSNQIETEGDEVAKWNLKDTIYGASIIFNPFKGKGGEGFFIRNDLLAEKRDEFDSYLFKNYPKLHLKLHKDDSKIKKIERLENNNYHLIYG